MKKQIITFLLLVFVCPSLYAQCNVSTVKGEDGGDHYIAQKEKVYSDPALESGIQFASLQLEVWQHPKNNDLLQFRLNAFVIKQGNKPLVVPRKIHFTFSDNSSLQLVANTTEDPVGLQGAVVYICSYKINSDNYIELQKKSISQIVIADNRSGESLTGAPFPDVLKEQANCIAARIKQ